MLEKIKINLRKYKITDIKQNNNTLIMITCPRKKTNSIIELIKSYDDKCTITTEKVKSFS